MHKIGEQKKTKWMKLILLLSGITLKAISLTEPVEKGKYWISSLFGQRKQPDGRMRFHNGIDMAALKGTPVKSAAKGHVEMADEVKGYGKTIVIDHGRVDGRLYKTRYAHLHEISVKKGAEVMQGQRIGAVGSTGHVRATGNDPSHLHFELYVDGERVDPLKFLKKYSTIS